MLLYTDDFPCSLENRPDISEQSEVLYLHISP